MCEKVRHNLELRDRLLSYVTSVIIETLPDRVVPFAEDGSSLGSRKFQPFIDSDNPDFSIIMAADLYNLILSNNMHSEHHTSSCTKYRHKRCRARFPRVLVPETNMNPEIGLIRV
jgi:hypothetical protein